MTGTPEGSGTSGWQSDVIVDLLHMCAYMDPGGARESGPSEIPAELQSQVAEYREKLLDAVVETDEGLMERYLDGDIPSFEELEKTLAHGVASAQVFPVLCGSASKAVAIDRLANFICEIGPSPLDRPAVLVEAGGSVTEVAPNPDGQPLAYVWKTIVDRHVGKISLFKVVSGSVKADDVLVNTRTRSDERLHGLFALRGKEQVPAESFPVGDLGAVAKLAVTAPRINAWS